MTCLFELFYKLFLNKNMCKVFHENHYILSIQTLKRLTIYNTYQYTGKNLCLGHSKFLRTKLFVIFKITQAILCITVYNVLVHGN